MKNNKDLLLAWLEQGPAALVLDTRVPGVIVPEPFYGLLNLVLNVSRKFKPGDLTINDWGVTQTLSFEGEGFHCSIPWEAVFLVVSVKARGFHISENIPEELAEKALTVCMKPMTLPFEKKKAKLKLSLVQK